MTISTGLLNNLVWAGAENLSVVAAHGTLTWQEMGVLRANLDAFPGMGADDSGEVTVFRRALAGRHIVGRDGGALAHAYSALDSARRRFVRIAAAQTIATASENGRQKIGISEKNMLLGVVNGSTSAAAIFKWSQVGPVNKLMILNMLKTVSDHELQVNGEPPDTVEKIFSDPALTVTDIIREGKKLSNKGLRVTAALLCYQFATALGDDDDDDNAGDMSQLFRDAAGYLARSMRLDETLWKERPVESYCDAEWIVSIHRFGAEVLSGIAGWEWAIVEHLRTAQSALGNLGEIFHRIELSDRILVSALHHLAAAANYNAAGIGSRNTFYERPAEVALQSALYALQKLGLFTWESGSEHGEISLPDNVVSMYP